MTQSSDSNEKRRRPVWARPLIVALFGAALLAGAGAVIANEAESPTKRNYDKVRAGAAPRSQTVEQANDKMAGCLTCHTNYSPYPSDEQERAAAEAAADAPSAAHAELFGDDGDMHASPAVRLGCTDCHGGDAAIKASAELKREDDGYKRLMTQAHVLPRYPDSWHYPHSANSEHTYQLLNQESPEFVRFVNPSDYRAARDSCGACHLETITAAERSLMATGAMLWGGASYNNGILPYKNYALGEAYTKEGEAATLLSPGPEPGKITPEQAARGALPSLMPLPTWQVTPAKDIFRVFEQGGRNIGTQFPEVGIPNPTGSIQRLEEPGRPDIRQSNRGAGTGLRVAIPVLNIHKTRLNDPYTWFMGTNDQPGDYRTSGCGSCHVVYANDREPRHSLTYAKFGRDGHSVTDDPTIPKDEPGHPLRHSFTRAIPTAQCMTCHMHQPNIFLNSFLGYTMWDYESDAPKMWPEKQKYPTAEEAREVLERNPEGASPKGKWSELDFLREVADLNPELKDTQFADYHGHGWNFRGIFKRDREGNLLDAAGKVVKATGPEKWREPGEPLFVDPPIEPKERKNKRENKDAPNTAVHLMSIHAEVGMQCADCHFSQDSHGSGFIHGEVANAIEVSCKDCHGTAEAYPTLRTSNVAAGPRGRDLSILRNPDGKRRFEWVLKDGKRRLIQRSAVDPKREWDVRLVKDSMDPTSDRYNAKAARAKLTGRATMKTSEGDYRWGLDVKSEDRAHGDDDMTCFTCHLSWTTSCGGCHLPIEANWETKSHKYGGGEKKVGVTTRNYATYNPQVARDDVFQLGLHQTTKGNVVAPIRSSSALVLSSTNINRERIYAQQPPIAASGFSSQAFAPHYPHTERTTETKTCSDCHLSAANDNNAIMAQLLLLGTNFVNFVGMHAWVGEAGALEAVRVTEWDEPQAVFGSYLQKYAYPDYYQMHVEKNGRELVNWVRGKRFDKKLSGETEPIEEIASVSKPVGGQVNCLQLRGEYLFVAEGKGGFGAYDVASISNKGVSERILTAPFSPLGHNTFVRTKNATCMALATNQPVDPLRNDAMLKDDKACRAEKVGQGMSAVDAVKACLPANPNQEQELHPIYSYAVVTDAEEGLVLVDVTTLGDGKARGNKFKRALTWNPNGALTGARHVTLAGHIAYIAANAGLVVVDLDNPLAPRIAATVPMRDARASAIQFRYLFVTTADGVDVLDVTELSAPRLIPEARMPLADARKVYLARTYAYIAAGADGLVIYNITNPTRPKEYQRVTFEGKLNDAQDVIVGSTNASLFAYVADGKNGLKVLQLTSPDSQPNFYGFSPEPKPQLIAWRKTARPAIALSKGLDRDRAVDETGGQIAVFGRLGSRPFTRPEMEKLFLGADRKPYYVSDAPAARTASGSSGQGER